MGKITKKRALDGQFCPNARLDRQTRLWTGDLGTLDIFSNRSLAGGFGQPRVMFFIRSTLPHPFQVPLQLRYTAVQCNVQWFSKNIMALQMTSERSGPVLLMVALVPSAFIAPQIGDCFYSRLLQTDIQPVLKHSRLEHISTFKTCYRFLLVTHFKNTSFPK